MVCAFCHAIFGQLADMKYACEICFAEDSNVYAELRSDLTQHSSWVLITDKQTHEYCKPHFLKRLDIDPPTEIVLLPGENQKSTERLILLWEELFRSGLDRKSAVVNLGGGMVTDLGGMAAATFKRGLALYNIPTSLLGMVDASIGGKNGINLRSAKNQIGTVYLPRKILIDVNFLDSLPQNEKSSGFAEVIKHALIADRELWESLRKLSNIEDITSWTEIIKRAVEVKRKIVQSDPMENGLRKLLNFGHTAGHALEAHFDELSHGHAIACGMIVESLIARELGIMSEATFQEIFNYLKQLYSLPVIRKEDLNSLIWLARQDKKNELGKLNFSLVDQPGRGKIDQIVDEAVFLNALTRFNELR